jgi:hypothetical protein
MSMIRWYSWCELYAKRLLKKWNVKDIKKLNYVNVPEHSTCVFTKTLTSDENAISHKIIYPDTFLSLNFCSQMAFCFGDIEK